MARVVRMKEPGGVEELEVAKLELPAPGPGEVLLRQTAIGVNFVDIYHRARGAGADGEPGGACGV